MKRENGWNNVINLLEKNYESDGSTVAFNTWKNLEHYKYYLKYFDTYTLLNF